MVLPLPPSQGKDLSGFGCYIDYQRLIGGALAGAELAAPGWRGVRQQVRVRENFIPSTTYRSAWTGPSPFNPPRLCPLRAAGLR